MNLLSSVVAGLRAGSVCKAENAGWVLSIVDSGMSQIAGAIGARRARVPHVLWVLDLWEENTYPKFDRLVARYLERRLWRNAAAVFTHCEEAAEHYQAKHGVQCQVLRTPIRDPGGSLARNPKNQPDASGRRAEVLCAGALYWAQANAVLRLERVAARLKSDLTLTILSNDETLTARVPAADRIERGVAESDFRKRLAQADLLFLGLSFNTEHPQIINTAAPARFPEYLASGVPMVVHAPAESHVARRARELDLAEVVDQPTEDALASAIQSVLNDPATAARRVARARVAALEHDHRVVADQMTEVLQHILDCRIPSVKSAADPTVGRSS